MIPQQKQVADWMVAFGQEVKEKPEIPSNIVLNLRAKLIQEEMWETIYGLGDFNPFNPSDDIKPDLITIADGIADSLVVLLGTAAACGIDIEPVFAEVMRSNWTKLWNGDDIPLEFKTNGYTVTLVEEHPECDIGFYLVKDKDGKVIKSPSYSPASITL